MRKVLLGVVLAAAAVAAQAGGSATITCGNAAPGVYNNGQVPTINVSYAPGSDTGTPGLFWLGILSPDQTTGAVLTIDQGWAPYAGGLYPFQSRYDNGLPGAITLTLPFPSDPQNPTLTTAGYVGYGMYVGHGAYTAASQQMVANRRIMLNKIKPQRVAAGTWQADYDSDDRFIWSLIQKDMVDNHKYGSILTVPFIDCTPIQAGGN
jgi:hypothetical protein